MEKEQEELKWRYELRMRDIHDKLEQVEELKVNIAKFSFCRPVAGFTGQWNLVLV